jgi:serine/threonine protein kinase
MSEPLNRESTDPELEPVLCPKCNRPLAKDLKFTVSSWFQTDPGSGLSRWQQCCKCGLLGEEDDDLPFKQQVRAAAQEEEQSLSQPILQTLHSVDEPLPSTPSGPSVPAQAQAGQSTSVLAEAVAVSPWAIGYDNRQSGQSTGAAPAPEPPETDSTTSAGATVASESSTESGLPKEAEGDQAPLSPQPPLVIGETNHPPGSENPPAMMVQLSMQTFRPAELGPAFLPPETRMNAPNPSLSQSYLIGGRYEVDSVIGKGTFGPTYRARDGATGRMMCLKLVSTPISRHRRIVKRIIQEVEKAKTLNHPHIVPIYDSAMDKSGRPFYVMDLIENGSLKKAIKEEGFLDVPEVLDIFLDVCDALSYAHEHGVLHRDLKPGNILLSGEVGQRRAKVADFGVIRALPSVGSEAQEMTQSTDVFADPSCMSPEQCLGRRLDVRSDIYSLGCSMYETIVGKRVFTGPNPLSIVVQHFKMPPRPFDAVMYNCDIHEDVEAVVMRMLDKAPENRYQEISQVLEDLRLLKAHRKPNYAYQKKKSQKGLIPFTNKDEENDAERLFDMVLHNQKPWERNQWHNAQPQVEADIERPARKNDPNARRQRIKVVRPAAENGGTAESLRAKAPENKTAAPPLEGSDKKWARESNPAPTSANKVFVPVPLSAADPTANAPKPEQRSYELRETPEFEEVSLFEDAGARAIITADQAKREIPEYLLEVSRAPYSFFDNWTPLKLVAVMMLVAAIMMTLWLVMR